MVTVREEDSQVRARASGEALMQLVQGLSADEPTLLALLRPTITAVIEAFGQCTQLTPFSEIHVTTDGDKLVGCCGHDPQHCFVLGVKK